MIASTPINNSSVVSYIPEKYTNSTGPIHNNASEERTRPRKLHQEPQNEEQKQTIFQKILSLITTPFRLLSSLWSAKTTQDSTPQEKTPLEYFGTSNALILRDQCLEAIFKLRDDNMLKTQLTDEICQQGFLGSSEAPNNAKKTYSFEEKKQKLQNKFLFHAETNGTVVAYALGSQLSEMAQAHPEIVNELNKLGNYNLEQGLFLNEICTKLEYRGQGIAKRLINSSKNLGGAKYILLTIDPQNKASIAAHEKMGAKKINDNFKFKGSPYTSQLYFLAL